MAGIQKTEKNPFGVPLSKQTADIRKAYKEKYKTDMPLKGLKLDKDGDYVTTNGDKLTSLELSEKWQKVAGTNLATSHHQNYLQNTPNGNRKANETLTKMQKKVNTNTPTEEIKDEKAKAAVELAGKSGDVATTKNSEATSAYDSGTMTPKSEVKNSKTATNNLQMTADVLAGKDFKKVANSNEGISEAQVGDYIIRKNGELYQLNQGDINAAREALGKDENADVSTMSTDQLAEAAKTGVTADKEITQEQAQENINKASGIIKENPQVEAAVVDAGYDVANDNNPPSPEVTDNILGNIKEETGVSVTDKDPKEVIEETAKKDPNNKLGLWDKIAIGLTAASFILAALSGGEIAPIDFTSIGGTQGRIAALTKLREQYDNNKAKLDTMANTDKDVERRAKDWKKNNPIKPGESKEDYEARAAAAAQKSFEQSALNASNVNAAQGETKALNNDTSESEKEMAELAHKFKVSEAELAHKFGMEEKQMDQAFQLKLIDKNGNWNMKALYANAAIQKELAAMGYASQEKLAALQADAVKSAATKQMIGGLVGGVLGKLF